MLEIINYPGYNSEQSLKILLTHILNMTPDMNHASVEKLETFFFYSFFGKSYLNTLDKTNYEKHFECSFKISFDFSHNWLESKVLSLSNLIKIDRIRIRIE